MPWRVSQLASASAAFKAESLHRKAAQHRTIDHRAPQRGIARAPHARQIAHEAAGETIPRSGRIVRLFEWKSRHAEYAVLSTIIAPYSPRLITSVVGPILKMCFAARSRLCSLESSRVSESLIIRMSTWRQRFAQFRRWCVRSSSSSYPWPQFSAALHLVEHVALQIGRDVREENVLWTCGTSPASAA